MMKMAEKKKIEPIEEVQPAVTFSKKQILKAKKYTGRKDLLNVLLKDGRSYAFDDVDKRIDKFMNGKVK